MKAKCPYCTEGCDRCQGGYVDVVLASGQVWTQHCDACGEDNGGRIACEEMLPPDQWKPPKPCVFCGSARTRWLDTGVSM